MLHALIFWTMEWSLSINAWESLMIMEVVVEVEVTIPIPSLSSTVINVENFHLIFILHALEGCDWTKQFYGGLHMMYCWYTYIQCNRLQISRYPLLQQISTVLYVVIHGSFLLTMYSRSNGNEGVYYFILFCYNEPRVDASGGGELVMEVVTTFCKCVHIIFF